MAGKILDVKQIMKKIPHRFPFVMIDRVLDYEERKWIKTLKNVTINEPFFQGHFPGEPVMPGVLMVEAMAQSGGMLALISRTELKDAIAFFMTIDNVKFRRPAVPGDQLMITATVLVEKPNFVKMHGEVKVDGNMVCEGDFMFNVMDRSKL